jgi:hypothetical protein
MLEGESHVWPSLMSGGGPNMREGTTTQTAVFSVLFDEYLINISTG